MMKATSKGASMRRSVPDKGNQNRTSHRTSFMMIIQCARQWHKKHWRSNYCSSRITRTSRAMAAIRPLHRIRRRRRVERVLLLRRSRIILLCHLLLLLPKYKMWRTLNRCKTTREKQFASTVYVVLLMIQLKWLLVIHAMSGITLAVLAWMVQIFLIWTHLPLSVLFVRRKRSKRVFQITPAKI